MSDQYLFQSVSARLTSPPLPEDKGTSFYGTVPNSRGQQVGARLFHDTTCTRCGRRAEAGECWTADLAPNMAGTWHHTDCDDPKLSDHA